MVDFADKVPNDNNSSYKPFNHLDNSLGYRPQYQSYSDETERTEKRDYLKNDSDAYKLK